MQRVGVYAGTFNPIHAGHIAFALQAMQAAKLDKLYFMPERRPRHKSHVEHYGHRVAMIRRAIQPHPKFGILDLPDMSFSVKYSLPRVQKQLPDTQIVFLMGSDVAASMVDWPGLEQLFAYSEVVIGLRQNADRIWLEKVVEDWPAWPTKLHLLKSYEPNISSHDIRRALRRREYAKGLLKSVQRYSNKHWLYVSLAEAVVA
jgi:nicotinate-nucleotide adenylyltransferase